MTESTSGSRSTHERRRSTSTRRSTGSRSGWSSTSAKPSARAVRLAGHRLRRDHDQVHYSVPDGPPSRRGPLSTAADFRKLTPLVVRQALEQAGTVVCEPIVHVTVELPPAASALSSPPWRGSERQSMLRRCRGAGAVEAVLSTTQSQDLQRRLPGLTERRGRRSTRRCRLPAGERRPAASLVAGRRQRRRPACLPNGCDVIVPKSPWLSPSGPAVKNSVVAGPLFGVFFPN